MTDLEKLKNTFDELGIEYTEGVVNFANDKYLFIHYTGTEFYFGGNDKFSHIEEQY